MNQAVFNFPVFLKQVPEQPGIYCLHNAQGEIIYVGKAKNLKRRLTSYRHHQAERKNSLNAAAKITSMLAAMASITFTITHTETEALLLEYNSIQKYKPRYNVLLRDDGAYPFILLTEEKHPRLLYHRGSQRIKGEYFGPFPNVQAVRETLTLLQRLFPLRQCEDAVYHQRTRPCLQYQMGRCLGPCIPGLVSDAAYQQQVEFVRLFLQGKNQQVLTQLVAQMEMASQALQFEIAARLRDQIQAIRHILEKQFVTNNHYPAADAISLVLDEGVVCIQVLMLRHGQLLGSRSFFPTVPSNSSVEDILENFINQYYLSCQMKSSYGLAEQLWLDCSLPNHRQLARSLSLILQQPLTIYPKPRGDRARYLQLARTNALASLQNRLAHRSTQQKRWKALKNWLNLPKLERMECFDISHTFGEKMVASCVVLTPQGPLRAAYRRYRITAVTPGDDYAAMAQALQRRYGKPLASELPDLIVIDGGKGQLKAAQTALSALNCPWGDHNPPSLIAIAKGPERRPGLETFWLTGEYQSRQLPATDPALHLLQQLRDEAHRHALLGHRRQRAKARRTSILQQIPGIGPKRRQALLHYLGGLQPLLKATVDEIAAVPSISRSLAERIYSSLPH
ncbi:MAG: excinuclease ABC subunit UvrC [Candidatus Symbiodolus clandestinus]